MLKGSELVKSMDIALINTLIVASIRKFIFQCLLVMQVHSSRQLIVKACDGRSGDSHPRSSDLPDDLCLPLAGADTDWREFRARLVASTASDQGPSTSEDEPWAHALASPEQGCLLLASPLYFLDGQQYFRNAVILIFHHNPQGSAGLILNRPTEYQLSDVAASGIGTEFGPCRLYLGGDVGPSSAHILHGMPGIQDSIQVLPGLYLGGFEGVKEALSRGMVTPEELKVLTRYCGWGPGQLESEISRGVWYVAATSKHVPLQPTLAGSGETLWHATMQLMGGEYAGLSLALNETLQADLSLQPNESASQEYSKDFSKDPHAHKRTSRERCEESFESQDRSGDHDYGSGI